MNHLTAGAGSIGCDTIKRKRISKRRIARQAGYEICDRLVRKNCVARTNYGLAGPEDVKRKPYARLEVHIVLVVR